MNMTDIAATKPRVVKPLKRVDLQVLRGGAIFCVLAFHLRPHTFPNGYLGVDTFFVLSGYLITTMLDRPYAHTQQPTELGRSMPTIWRWWDFCYRSLSFYSRRVKRILPTYAFMLLWVLLAGGLAFGRLRSRTEQLEYDTLWAAAFATNLKQMRTTVSYGDMVSPTAIAAPNSFYSNYYISAILLQFPHSQLVPGCGNPVLCCCPIPHPPMYGHSSSLWAEDFPALLLAPWLPFLGFSTVHPQREYSPLPHRGQVVAVPGRHTGPSPLHHQQGINV